ncbi:MAG: chromosome segregation protein SMC [Candidatus Zixiibacteriota bacterium]|nr:MAG: chromosome segregation protein SMC [candidate division Zixibacteria bacterium]
MYLSSLDIFGFKSFAQRTRINFASGLTAIVGPNGCGKSNLVDAVRWVLGEQRESALRSERMENIIFGGTGKRRPLGMAEISLTLKDPDGRLPVEFDEITVTRRLYRSGKSEYLLNKSTCRLRDLVDMFTDTGIGPDSYSIIELKMVEDILSGNPEEMRRILDEAIGITRYKLRRKEALRKLAEARQDRERALDIFAEVERQTKALHRQVARVQSYRRLQEKAARVRAAIVLARVQELESQLEPLAGSLGDIRTRMEAETGELASAEAALMRLEGEILQLEEERRRHSGEFHAAQSRHQALAAEKTRLEEEVRSQVWRLEKNKDESKRLAGELESVERQGETAQADLAARQERFPGLEARLGEIRGSFTEVDNRYREIRTQTQAGRDELTRLRQQETEAIRDQERRAAQVRSLEERRADLAARLQEQESRLVTRRAEAESLQGVTEELTAQIHAVREKAAAQSREAEALRTAIREKERELDQNVSARSQIQFQIKHFQELHRRSSPLFAAGGPLAARYPDQISATLGDELVVDETYLKAVETALMAFNYSRVLDDPAQLEAVRDFISQEGAGRAALLVGDPPDVDIGRAREFAAQAGGEALAEAVAGGTRAAQWIRYLLQGIVLLPGLEEARRWASAAGESGVALVTPEGEYTDGRGVWIVGRRKGEAPRVLGVSARMKELERQRREGEVRHREIGEEIAQLQEEVRGVVDRLKVSQDSLKKAEQTLDARTREKLQLEAQLSGANLLAEQIRREAGEVDARLREAAAQPLDSDLPAIIERLRAREAEQRDREAGEAKVMDERESVRMNLERVQIEVERGRAELTRARDHFHGLARRRDDLQRRLKELSEENRSVETRLEETEKQVGEQSEKVTQAEQALSEIRRRLEDFDTGRMELQETQKLQNQRVREYRANLETYSRQVHETELRSVEIEATLREERRRLEGVDPAALEGEEANPEVLAQLERKILSLEPLNLAAEAEYNEQMARLQFLQDQLKDLDQAEADLQQTITTLNREARERFENGFGRIRENLQRIFQGVFEGGKADLRLTDDDPLESEIELMAAPPGKRIGSLTLLSGGEKTLTAISLLFAVYLEKPSPFCILDEVDAPLDEENTGRFCRMLKNFSLKTQFLVVTHNKRMMMEAEQLLGITMEEEGVSKVVPVKVN